MYSRLGKNCTPPIGTALTNNNKYFAPDSKLYNDWKTTISRFPFCDPLYNQGIQSVAKEEPVKNDKDGDGKEDGDEGACDACGGQV